MLSSELRERGGGDLAFVADPGISFALMDLGFSERHLKKGRLVLNSYPAVRRDLSLSLHRTVGSNSNTTAANDSNK